jgi:hypothetical protein
MGKTRWGDRGELAAQPVDFLGDCYIAEEVRTARRQRLG